MHRYVRCEQQGAEPGIVTRVGAGTLHKIRRPVCIGTASMYACIVNADAVKMQQSVRIYGRINRILVNRKDVHVMYR